MAADNNKNPAPEKKEAESQVRVGDSSRTVKVHQFLPRGDNNKKLLLSLIAIVVVVIGGALFIGNGLHVGQKVYAEAAGHKIYKKDVQDLIGSNKGISNNQAATVLANKYLAEAMMKKQGITVTNNDIEAAYGPIINMQRKDNGYAYQYQVNRVYFNKLQADQQGSYKGEVLVAQFSRYIAYKSGILAEDKAAEPKIGDPAAIAADKKYAQDFITKLYNQIQSHQITFDQAVQIEHADPVVGENAYQTLSHSGPFDTTSQTNDQNSLVEASSIQQQIRSMKPGQISKPFVVRVSNSIDNDSTAESYYLVVRMDSVSGHPTNMSFDEYVAQAKKQLGYKVNV